MKWTDQSPSPLLPEAPPAIVGLTSTRDLCRTDHGSAAEVSVQIAQEVHDQVLMHLRSASHELGGLLLGMPWGRPGDRTQAAQVTLVAAIAATESSGTGYSLRMEAGVWSAANDRLAIIQASHPDARVVGWYHSHPGLSAFFSATDRATQAAFFPHAYSVGWCIDPEDDSHACFIGSKSLPARRSYLFADDAVPGLTRAG